MNDRQDCPTRLGSSLMSDLRIHDLVQLQSSVTPDSVALVSGNRHVTYRELNARANQLAHRLRFLGIGPDVPVGLCMERSVELPIAALGILKAGGAYMPLDPTYPSRRLSMLLEDSGTPLVVTQPCVAGKLPAGKWRTLVLDGDGLDSDLDASVSPVANTRPENLAYIIFTSGSTGRPKGVQITHGSLHNLVDWHQRAFNVSAVDKATLLASPGFDAAVWELWPYLAAGASLYVVDENLQRVTDGTAGELLIGGRGVGRGYLNAVELTAERFIPDSFSGDPGARLYRTGDFVRLLPDGQIAFMGRIDDQIKVMGHRIEPQEIITVLERHPEIEASFVWAYSDPSGNQRLVAYVVPTTDTPPQPSDLRNFLGAHLPSHMLPSAFVQLTQLPLSPHGKLDRAALPQPTTENILRDDSLEAHESTSAQHLSVVLSALLGVKRVGSEDNFFTLGGHSLMGAQLITKIRENFGVELSLRCLFEEPTPRGMSAEIEKLIHARFAAMSEEEAQRLLASSAEGD